MRAYAEAFAKCAREMTLIAEAAIHGDVRERVVRGDDALAGALNANAAKIFARTYAVGAAKCAGQINRMDSRVSSEIGETERTLAATIADGIAGAAEPWGSGARGAKFADAGQAREKLEPKLSRASAAA